MRRGLRLVALALGLSALGMVCLWSPAVALAPEACPGRVTRVDFDSPSIFTGIAADDSIAVTTDVYGLSTWDLNDPSIPRRLASWDTLDNAAYGKVRLDDRGFAYSGYVYPSGSASVTV